MNRFIANKKVLAVVAVLLISAGAAAQQSAPLGSGVPEGCKLIEGDIIVPIDFTFEDTSGIGVRGVFDTNWWPGGNVPFQFDANVTAAHQNDMLAAMAEWEAVANVDFRERDGEADYIHIQDALTNSSHVGRAGGRQVVNIFNWDFQFIMAHELGHALGLWHEHSRPDRNTYVTIHLGSITDAEEHNFTRHTGADTYGSYDFDSLMHYGQCAFTNCTCPANCVAIEVNSPWDTQWQSAIGQRDHLSTIDQLTMQMMYPRAGDMFVDKSYTGATENGSFLHPYKAFPDGAAAVPSGGRVVIQPGAYTSCVGTYSTAMTLWAPLGDVTLGQ